MGFRVSRLLPVVALTPFVASVAFAQDVGKPADTTAPAATSTTAAPAGASTGGGSTNTTTTTAPTASAAPTSTSAPTMGYAYGGSHHTTDAAAPKPRTRARVHHVAGPVATLPGFLLLPEGGSRLFVELTQNVAVEEKPVAGGITYVLKGAHIVKRNNENALVTVHFNTPVTRARLLPAGGDLHFVIELRQNVKPTWKLVPAKDGAAVLQIDFPGGSFLPNDSSQANADAAKAAGADTKKSDAKRAPKP